MRKARLIQLLRQIKRKFTPAPSVQQGRGCPKTYSDLSMVLSATVMVAKKLREYQALHQLFGMTRGSLGSDRSRRTPQRCRPFQLRDLHSGPHSAIPTRLRGGPRPRFVEREGELTVRKTR